MLGGTGGRRRGGTNPDPVVTSGQAKVTRRRLFGAAGETLAERQDGWCDTDNRWSTTDGLTAVGGQPLQGGSAACASSGVWQGLWRCFEIVSILDPTCNLKNETTSPTPRTDHHRAATAAAGRRCVEPKRTLLTTDLLGEMWGLEWCDVQSEEVCGLITLPEVSKKVRRRRLRCGEELTRLDQL
jgi:hypothetical protein